MNNVKTGYLILGIIFLILGLSALPATLGISAFVFGIPAKKLLIKAFEDTNSKQ